MWNKSDYANNSRIPGEAAQELDFYRLGRDYDSDAIDRFADLIKSCLPYVSVMDSHFDVPLYQAWVNVFEQIGDSVEDVRDPSELVTKLKVARTDLEFPSGMGRVKLNTMVNLCVECSVEFMARSASD